MKIIATDNLNRETVSELLVAENVTNKEFAQVMASALNERFCHDGGGYYFIVKADDATLYQYEP